MKNWIVTGGAGTGKSTFLRLLREQCSCDAVFFSADEEVRRLYGLAEVKKALEEAFGAALFPNGREGEVNRAWLREHVLPQPRERERLEAILHPRVYEGYEKAKSAAEEAHAKVLVAEIPLHYEGGGTVSADLIIVVAASRSVQVKRMMDNRGLDEQTVKSFLNAQLPIEAKAERADAVIWNDGGMDALEAQVLTLVSSQL